MLVPELLRLLVTAAERGWKAPPSLRFVAVGGAPVSVELLARAAGRRAAGVRGLRAQRVRVGRVPEHARGPAPGQRRAGPCRTRASASRDDGQIMVSGVTMLGYLGEPPRRAGEEWATGDLGEIDADGYVYVRGRLRNLFITSLGRNVAPEWVEREIALQPGIRHVMVLGEARPYAVAWSCATDERRCDDATPERGIAAANAACPTTRRCGAGRARPSPSPSPTACSPPTAGCAARRSARGTPRCSTRCTATRPMPEPR